jgi:tryptophan-rich sensory protein
MFTTDDAIKVIGLFVFIFWQISVLTTKEIRAYYEKKRNVLFLNPEPYIFGPIWTIIFSCMFVSGYLFLYSGAPTIDQGYFTGLFVTFFVCVYLKKIWMVAFFDHEMSFFALVIVILDIMSTITFLVLAGIIGTIWWSFGLMIPALIQLVFAFIWNFQWYNAESHDEIKKDTRKPNTVKLVNNNKKPKVLNL